MGHAGVLPLSLPLARAVCSFQVWHCNLRPNSSGVRAAGPGSKEIPGLIPGTPEVQRRPAPVLPAVSVLWRGFLSGRQHPSPFRENGAQFTMAMPLHQVYVPETHVLLFVLKETRCRESEHPLPIQAPWRTAALLCTMPRVRGGLAASAMGDGGGERHGRNATLQLGSPSTSLQGR